MKKNNLWIEWSKAFSELRSAFSRTSTFYWATIVCAGLILRMDHRGIGSIVNAFGLRDACYYSLLRACHSSGINLERLSEVWIQLCFKLFTPTSIDGYAVIYGDGIKIAKEGRKMPAVKSQRQESSSNSKAEFIMGHYLQAFSLSVVTSIGKVAAIPLFAFIHDGLVFSNRSKKPSTVKFAEAVSFINSTLNIPVLVVADAYYGVSSVISILNSKACFLISRVAHNTVAYASPLPSKPGKLGRPKKMGEKIKLSDLFLKFDKISTTYGNYRYYSVDLYWPSAGQVVRFVLSQKSSKNRAILLSTNIHLTPEVIIQAYASRWLIETGFKNAIHVLGTYAYHFWMKTMTPIKRKSSKQHLHHKTSAYRTSVLRKMKAFHIHVVLGCIAQGLLLHLAINFRDQVMKSFNGWIRTINKDSVPSELIVQNALRAEFPLFLKAAYPSFAWTKVIKKNIDPGRFKAISRAA